MFTVLTNSCSDQPYHHNSSSYSLPDAAATIADCSLATAEDPRFESNMYNVRKLPVTWDEMNIYPETPISRTITNVNLRSSLSLTVTVANNETPYFQVHQYQLSGSKKGVEGTKKKEKMYDTHNPNINTECIVTRSVSIFP